MANNKLSSNLSLPALAIKYDVNANGIEQLKKAIEAGEIADMLQACADEKFGGDMKPVLAQFNRNLSSQRCTRKITDSASKNRADMVEALWDMTHVVPRVRAAKGMPSAPRAGFLYTRQEVDELVAENNVAELQRFYDNVHSNVNKAIGGLSTTCYAEELANNPKLARWIDVKAYVSEKLRDLKAFNKAKAKAQTMLPVAPEVSEGLAKKLDGYVAGKRVSFTPEQMEELLKLLNR